MNPQKTQRHHITVALARAKAAGVSHTAEAWANEFQCAPSYVSRIAHLSETREAIKPASEQTVGVIHVTKIGQSGVIANVGKNMLRAAHLLGQDLLQYRVDPASRTITITAAEEVR